jgi:hypothetical protein
MYNNSCLEKDDTQLVYLIDDFASDLMVQPVDGLLGGMEKVTDIEDRICSIVAMRAFKKNLVDFCERKGETVSFDKHGDPII